jgi:class 3 adenylate cyclase/tetratricopeptide (TPR) repeat protein
MKCPKCQFENPETVKFCGECGAKLEQICPKCNSPNPLPFKFCGECGQKLGAPYQPLPKELSFDEKIGKLQKYLPRGLTEKVLSQRDKIEGEHRQVTVMFADMQGFTPLVEKLGPEEAYSVMDQVYEILIHKVHDYEGTVNEMTGDGIMALFGAPIALEDAPQRAIRSAHAIQREMVKLSEKIKLEKGLSPIRMRVGIHTGPVVVGTLGNDLRVEFKAVGDTVNLASRMEGLAEPGTTYVTEDTFKLTEGFFRFEGLGEKEIKGKDIPVKVYQVIAPSTRRTRFDVSAERGLTPFVGRERELELLLDGFGRIKEGRGQAFSIMGEAGVGKSRLLYEFRKAITNEDVTFLEGKCLSYGRGTAYHPIIDILKSNFNVREDEGDFEIREKVKKGLEVLKAEQASTLPYFLELLSVKDSGLDNILMSPEGKKDRIIESLKHILLKGSEIRPLVMAIEDLHWADKSTEDALKYCLESIPGARVLLMFTYRPEFVHTWGGKSYHSQVTLYRLSNRESLAMAAHVLGVADIDRNLEELILRKTEGVPFFIEEFIKSLKDLKIIERRENKCHLAKEIQALTIPSTIQSVIMARVDSLPERAKEVLQIGSVIEREFSYEMIKRVTELPEQELLSCLSSLKDSELIYERGIYPQLTYIFKHALTQEVVYDSILTKKRMKLHERIGDAMVKLFENNLSEYYGVLARHFIEAENFEQGAAYSELASKKANQAASSKEVFENAQKRIFCLERLSSSESNLKRAIDARAALAMYYINYSHIGEAYEVVAPIADMALKINYEKALPMIYTAMGAFQIWYEEDHPKGVQYLNEVLRFSERTPKGISYFLTTWNLGWFFSWDCQFAKGGEYFQRALEMSKAANNPLGISSTNSTLSGINYIVQGKIDLAFKTTEESLRVVEESGDIYAQGLAYSSYGLSCYLKGDFEQAERFLLKGLPILEKISQAIWSAWDAVWLGWLYTEKADYEKAKYYFDRGKSILLENGKFSPSLMNMFTVSLARSEVLDQRKDIHLSDLFKCYQNNRLKILEGLIARYIGEILLNIDDQNISESEKWIGKAIEADKRNGTIWFLGGDYASYSGLHKRKGNLPGAREYLGKALETFKEIGADGWATKYEKELAFISNLVIRSK